MNRITVTIPNSLVQEIDKEEHNRSRFVQEAVERELERRKQERLQQSIDAPHPEIEALAAEEFDSWVAEGDADAGLLVDPDAGAPLRWTAGRGWERS